MALSFLNSFVDCFAEAVCKERMPIILAADGSGSVVAMIGAPGNTATGHKITRDDRVSSPHVNMRFANANDKADSVESCMFIFLATPRIVWVEATN